MESQKSLTILTQPQSQIHSIYEFQNNTYGRITVITIISVHLHPPRKRSPRWTRAERVQQIPVSTSHYSTKQLSKREEESQTTSCVETRVDLITNVAVTSLAFIFHFFVFKVVALSIRVILEYMIGICEVSIMFIRFGVDRVCFFINPQPTAVKCLFSLDNQAGGLRLCCIPSLFDQHFFIILIDSKSST